MVSATDNPMCCYVLAPRIPVLPFSPHGSAGADEQKVLRHASSPGVHATGELLAKFVDSCEQMATGWDPQSAVSFVICNHLYIVSHLSLSIYKIIYIYIIYIYYYIYIYIITIQKKHPKDPQSTPNLSSGLHHSDLSLFHLLTCSLGLLHRGGQS